MLNTFPSEGGGWGVSLADKIGATPGFYNPPSLRQANRNKGQRDFGPVNYIKTADLIALPQSASFDLEVARAIARAGFCMSIFRFHLLDLGQSLARTMTHRRGPTKAPPCSTNVATLRVQARSSMRHLGCVITRNQEEITMTKLMKKIRSVLRSLTQKAKVKLSVALSIPGFLKVEVAYEKTLAPPDKPDDA